jgi:hypothetical protein
LNGYFGLERLDCFGVENVREGCPRPKYHGGPIISDEASYEAIRPYLFSDDSIARTVKNAQRYAERHGRGEISVRLWLDGYFWFPRTLFGIEGHFYSFFDHPELLARINRELSDHQLRAAEAVFAAIKPDIVCFAEDMSYNHGPMLSLDQFNEFLLPYYEKVVPFLKKSGAKVLVDTDGDVTRMVPWLVAAGIDGIFPLERQAGVDVAELRREYPGLIMLGAYDKMAMSRGEGAIRGEFERLLPVMRSGGFVPSVDHQTPPEVSLSDYRTYLRLFDEYCERATAG